MGPRPTEVLRCRQCGWAAAFDPSVLPRYGARPRCGGCGSLLPLVVRACPPEPPAPEQEPGRPRDAAQQRDIPDAGAPARMPSDSEGRPGSGSPQSREDAPEGGSAGDPEALIRSWLQTLRQRAGEPVTEAIVWAEHGAALARIYADWRRDAAEADAPWRFREALFRVLGAYGPGFDRLTDAPPSGTEESPDRAIGT